MPTFMSFVNWTDATAADPKGMRQRQAGAKEMVAKFGGTVIGLYVVTGQYDAVMIAEFPDGDAMTKMALSAGQTGHVRTHTVRAFTEDEIGKIVDDM